MNRVIGVVGEAGSGKTIVCEYFLKLGYRVVNADKLAHQLYQNTAVKEKLKNLFSSAFVDGEFKREVLAEIVFNDSQQLSKLNNFIHPLMKEEIKKIINLSETVVILEMAILFSSNFNELCNSVLYVDCSLEKRRERLQRQGIDVEKIQKINNLQKRFYLYKSRCNYVIINDKDNLDYQKQIEVVLEDELFR